MATPLVALFHEEWMLARRSDDLAADVQMEDGCRARVNSFDIACFHWAVRVEFVASKHLIADSGILDRLRAARRQNRRVRRETGLDAQELTRSGAEGIDAVGGCSPESPHVEDWAMHRRSRCPRT